MKRMWLFYVKSNNECQESSKKKLKTDIYEWLSAQNLDLFQRFRGKLCGKQAGQKVIRRCNLAVQYTAYKKFG